MAINQAYLFLIFTLNGVFIGLLFDFFRILRKTFKTINLITYIEDIMFWILTGISIIFCMYKFSDGSLRLYMFLGLAFGIIMYMLTISKFIIKTFVILINAIKKIIITPIKIIYKILKKYILKPIYNIYNKTRKNVTKTVKKDKKSKKISLK